jgi:hypothetical protein
MNRGADDAIRTLLQVTAICVGTLFVSMVLHKAFVDIAALAHKHADGGFWLALAQYFLRNLAGGG